MRVLSAVYNLVFILLAPRFSVLHVSLFAFFGSVYLLLSPSAPCDLNFLERHLEHYFECYLGCYLEHFLGRFLERFLSYTM